MENGVNASEAGPADEAARTSMTKFENELRRRATDP